MKAVRLNGGNTLECLDYDCAGQFDLISGTSSVTLENVEAQSAVDKGVQVTGGTLTVKQSWLHNNYRGNIDASGVALDLQRSMVERAGLRVTDDLQVDAQASGLSVTNFTSVTTEANVIRNNVVYGLGGFGSSTLNIRNDYLCGNGSHGLLSSLNVSVNGMGGIVTAYNQGNGVRATPSEFAPTILNNDSAFLSNAQCGVFNTTTSSDFIEVENNQWRSTASPPDTCAGVPGAGPVTFITEQNEDEALSLAPSAAFPSNVLLRGQTIRASGELFDAVDGNPLPTVSCQTGAIFAAGNLSQSCCRQPGKANICGSGAHNPLLDKGTCVELMDVYGTWTPLAVTSATPTTLVTEIPSSVFPCIGTLGESIGASKRLPGGGLSLAVKPYCTNDVPL